MSPLAAACRLSARVVSRKLAQDAATRGYRTSAAALAASNFTMPALSPTMTEGNIASWKVKEGDSFAAGDVLLEIETDKATMDVEAQDDGVVVKITQTDGSKAVQVGTRIAVMAEPGDDISALEIPPDEKPAVKGASREDARVPATELNKEELGNEAKKSSTGGSNKPAAKQTYPLLPSVKQLMMQKGVSLSEIPKMAPTGPKGRLLKGDVLAYLGMVDASRPEDIQTRFDKLSHLDLSNVKVAAPKESPKRAAPAKEDKPTAPEPEPKLDIALPISLFAVIEVQKRLEETLGVNMPLSTFIARATELANDGLPLAGDYKSTADELFDQVLGLDTVSPKATKGFYIPQISALPQAQMAPPRRATPKTNADIIDILTSRVPKPPRAMGTAGQVGVALSTGTNYFTLTVPKAEEKRARVFLERVKSVLEEEPGRLVL